MAARNTTLQVKPTATYVARPQVTVTRRIIKEQKPSAENEYADISTIHIDTSSTILSSQAASLIPESKGSSVLQTDKQTKKPQSITHNVQNVSPESQKKTNSPSKDHNSATDLNPNPSDVAKRKKIIIAVIIGAISIVCLAAILIPVLVLRTSNAATTTAITSTAAPILAYWSFDNTVNDFYNNYNGVLVNGATYLAASSTTNIYVAHGAVLSLNALSSQSVHISSPFLSLSYISFTIEAWIFATSVTSDRGIFTQCQCSTCMNQCFTFLIRTSRLYAGFFLNDVSGSTTLATNTWYHVAFVYNYNTRQQILYLNGVQDGISSNSAPYQALNGSIYIGAAQVLFSTVYFNGYIDNLRLVTQAKSSSEILFDATVTAYYSFDVPNLAQDNGPNGFNGTFTNVAFVNGVVNQALRLLGTVSYFQAYGFYQLAYSMNSKPFSVSLWLNPSSLLSVPIVQVSRSQTSSPCENLLNIYSLNGGATGQLQSLGYSGCCSYSILGPFIYVNTWLHVSITYSSTNGLIMYINGSNVGTTGGFTSTTSGYITWLEIGNTLGCVCCSAVNPYQGAIDELYVHSRELTAAEVLSLATS